jgi:hypothetical protein
MREKPKRFHILKESINPTWRSKKGEILISEMDNEYLQSAKLYAQTQILHYFNKMNIFVKLQEQLEEEANNRNILLKDLDEVKKTGDYFEKTRVLKQNTSKLK